MVTDDAHLIQTFKTYSNDVKKWMLAVGVWPVAKPKTSYRLLGMFAIVSNFFTAAALIRFVILNISNLNVVVKGISTATSLVTTFLKGFLLVFYKKDLLRIYETLSNYHKESLKDENTRGLMLEKVLSFRPIQKIQTFTCGVSAGVYVLVPMFALRHHSVTNSSSLENLLPIPAAFPWRIQPIDGLYIITYIYVSYNLFVLVCLTCGVDVFFSLIMLHIVGQLRVMSYKMDSIKEEDEYAGIVRECVIKYSVLKECCATLQNIYGPIILWMVVTNSIIMCTVFFQLSQLSQVSGVPITRYIMMFCYVSTKVLQTYGYAFSGTALTTESELFLDSVYFSNWLGKKRHSFRTSVMIILTQKALDITIVKFILVSMDMFVTIMNSTVSYFFLLKTFEESPE